MTAPTTSAWRRAAFWARAVLETLGARSFRRLLRARVGPGPVEARGLEHVPAGGGFVLAVNHYHARLTFDVIAATLLSASSIREDAADTCSVVVGQRLLPGPPSPLRRIARGCARWLFDRWAANAVRIPLDERRGVGPLRAVVARARVGPVLVFPEGVARGAFADLRAGSGRFLAGLGVPVVPVGVLRCDEGWRVTFGAALEWATERRLHDLQLGLAIAALLPPTEAPSWQPLLARWREAHAPVRDEARRSASS